MHDFDYRTNKDQVNRLIEKTFLNRSQQRKRRNAFADSDLCFLSCSITLRRRTIAIADLSEEARATNLTSP